MNPMDKRAVSDKHETPQKESPFDFAPWKPPFRYSQMGSEIRDANSQKVIDIRGWGFLTGTGGGLAIDPEIAVGIQDRLGELVTKLLNEVSVSTATESDSASGASSPNSASSAVLKPALDALREYTSDPSLYGTFAGSRYRKRHERAMAVLAHYEHVEEKK